MHLVDTDAWGKEVRVQSWRIPGLRFLPDARQRSEELDRSRFISTYALASRADVIDYKRVTQETLQKRWILTVEGENPNEWARHCQQKKKKRSIGKKKWVWTTTIPWIWFRQSDRPKKGGVWKPLVSNSKEEEYWTELNCQRVMLGFDYGLGVLLGTLTIERQLTF